MTNSVKMDKALERKLWKAVDALRGSISYENYMPIIIGIMFIKHMSDKYEKAVAKFEEKIGFKPTSKDLEDPDYLAKLDISFIVPKKARWSYIARFASSPTIGIKMDEAFELIEQKNSELKGFFEKNYNREELDQQKLGQLVSELTNLDSEKFGDDVIGHTCKFFLGQFFLKQVKRADEFYTPDSIVKLMVEIINPRYGKIYDPTAGTGGMLIQARNHLKKTGGNVDELVAFGQESQNKIWKLLRINLLLHDFPLDNIYLGKKSADTLIDDLHKTKKFDYVLADPPYNLKNLGYENLFKWNYNGCSQQPRCKQDDY